LRKKFLRSLYKLFPFDLKGDCLEFKSKKTPLKLSCVINFYGRLDLLSGILHSLSRQDYPRELFEVVLVEDQGGTVAGRDLCESFSETLQIVYKPLTENFGKMGHSRNFGLSNTQGEYVLFLDDDTVILQQDFLRELIRQFDGRPEVDAIIPHGKASYAMIEGRYDYHDPYFMTSRCMAYRRQALQDLGGFIGAIIGQEDVEFVVRFSMAGKAAIRCENLNYYHPPLLAPDFRKPAAVGQSFFRLKCRYPFIVWFLLLLNCCRHAPLILFPGMLCRQMGRFGCGFLLGVFQGFRGQKDASYG